MRDFILDKIGPSGLACVFEDDGETGISTYTTRTVGEYLKIYKSTTAPVS